MSKSRTYTHDPAPWTIEGSARDITHPAKWPAAAVKARENPDRIVRVLSRDLFRAAFANNGGDPADALFRAETCRLYIRNTDSAAHVLAIVGCHGESHAVRYGTAGGFGYDRVTSAAQGIPVAPGVILTDHCGRDGELASNPDAPFPNLRQFTVTSERYLPPDLFLVE